MAVKRRYRSDRRAAAALATRADITAAARRLFVANGYASTSIVAIAAEAGVAVQTVYAVFGNKRAVLESMLDVLDDQAGLEALKRGLEDPSAARQAAAVAAFMAQLFDRGADIIAVARGASASEPALRALAAEGLVRHQRGTARVATGWHRGKALRPGLSAADAAAILGAIASYEVYQQLRGSGWTLRRYERWLAATIVTLLLREAAE
ncbi:MAG: helix-turn-helix domain-containing protein [Vicinamibacteraceae bacterium]